MEYAFVVLILSGLMLATSLLLVATDGHGNGFEGLFILCGMMMAAFVVSGWYFIAGIRGHLSKKRSRKGS
ncbi:hypothetical protein KC968_04215 [Candidatus Saccharibacteria bacterium]|nr:hypothetical protein [Candidatus Saccharibacteria bacterium]